MLRVLLKVIVLTSVVLGSVVAPRAARSQASAKPSAGARGEQSGAKEAGQRRREAFELVWRTVKELHYDPTFGGLDWDAVKTEFAPRAEAARTDWELHRLLQEMLNRLGQSHFNVIPPESIPSVEDAEAESAPDGEDEEASEEAETLRADRRRMTEHMTYGIGVDVRVIDKALVITRVEPLSPAERAGLRPGYVVRSVDGVRMRAVLSEMRREAVYQPSLRHQIPSEIVLGYFNGEPGTHARVAYLDARNRLRRVSVRRERLRGEMSPPLQSFPAQFVEFESRRLRGGVGYIRFSLFAPPVMEKFCTALRTMSDAPGVVIDLRGNRGGLLGMMYGMGGLLVRYGGHSFGQMLTRDGRMEFRVVPQRNPYTGQVVVLIDAGSMSASEIFASGLEESGRAILIGERSAGSTLPSAVVELPTGAVLQYAFADFRTHHGNRLEGRGVKPTVEVRLDRRSLLAGRDAQLEAAVDAVGPTVSAAPVATGTPPAVKVTDAVAPTEAGEALEDAETPANEVESSAAVDSLVSQIVERYERAVGGREAVEKFSSRVTKGTFEGTRTGVRVSGTLETFERAPDKAVTHISVPGAGVTRRGYTGKYGYEQNPMFGFRELGGVALADARLAAQFYWSVNLKKLYPKMIHRGREKIGEAEADVLEATPLRGSVTKLYFDVKTGLLLRRDETFFEDYRDAGGGVMLPHTTRFGNLSIKLTEVKYNVAIDDAKFAEEENCFTRAR